MNYQGIYNNIINKAKIQFRSKQDAYFERHHILPKCLGGGNTKENLVLLTAKEHYICHLLLCKIYKNDIKIRAKMLYAFYMMKTKYVHHMRYNGKSFEWAKLQLYGSNGCARGENSIWYGKKHSNTSKEKMRTKRKIACQNPNERERLKLLATNRTEEHKEKIINANKGKKRSTESKLRMSESHKGLQLNEKNGKSRKCIVMGTIYPSIREAGRSLNINSDTILSRIRSQSNRFLDYQYA